MSTSLEGSGIPGDGDGLPDKEFMTTLAKGLAVLGAFGADRPSMTLSEAASVAGLSRATARRVLLTLSALGYVVQSERQFFLAPKILELGFGFLSTQSWIDRAEPLMKELSAAVKESCSAAVLQDTEVVNVARVPVVDRIMSATLAIGSRLPAFHSSLGRIQLGYLGDDEIWRRLRTVRIEPYTPSTITDPSALVERIRVDHAQGFSIVDEELERGHRSIAVPIATRNGVCIAAIDLSAQSNRTTRNEMREIFLPKLRAVAGQIAHSLPGTEA
jgi:IclR family pca regulon transcriptional regulator